MIPDMTSTPDHTGRRAGASRAGDVLSISCDDCSMRCSTHCDDCLVSFVVDGAPPTPIDVRRPSALARSRHPAAGGRAPVAPAAHALVLDASEARAVELLTRAGLLPELRFERSA